ncbi:type II methionyl aminopeptidase [Natrialba asiatica]|uniref:Methionine aminopeptidase n=1 Tax=Natrialba asiatica (strain ATCC 700177 / DSM 12278 / JCM 9576 / FERM P-10747 / NBRC 102637 / 172P1) TaxID=29540 RepID=M0AZ58_NATA1|nr:type II methionyl aminopeptidase [Natrialba asiatica]ELZ02714.1 methionine aminopeptidase [Natrialba asiatica DSM 12278]
MAPGDLSEEAWLDLQKAGEILSQVFDETIPRIEPGVSRFEIADHAETRIRDLGGNPAFPVNINVNEEASHAIPTTADESTFDDSDLVTLDMGVHVNGWCSDAAVTIDLSGTHDELVAASDAALAAALRTIEAGVHTGTVGHSIEQAIRDRGFRPVVNLAGHGLGHYDAHTDPMLPNTGSDNGIELSEGDVLAVETFATTGRGRVTEGSDERIFRLDADRPVRDRRGRKLLDTLRETRRNLPFTTRWYDISGLTMTVRNLERKGVLKSDPVLKAERGALVSQSEHTAVVTANGCTVTTR